MPRAVIFTHIKESKKLGNTAHDVGEFTGHRQKFFESCLQCRNIAIVYVYSSYGVEKYVEALLANGAEAKVPIDVLDGEERLHDALEVTVDEAASVVGGGDDVESVKARGPKFVFIGVRELACHVSRLLVQSPDLVLSLASKGEFTYDSPKYVEAILRLVRNKNRELAGDPIIRVDADVIVNEKALQRIIDKAAVCSETDFWWFSGSYRGTTAWDPVNAFAVRQHWLIDPDTWNDPAKFRLVAGGEHFLVDLAEIGATQYASPLPVPKGDERAPCLSDAAKAFIRDERGDRSKARPCPQVISGAGLFASPHAIRELPPFMNAPAMVVWIDDYLKWLLHDTLGHFGKNNIERVAGATMRQNRFPTGIEPKDIAELPKYFERLLTGCVLEAAIQDAAGAAGPLTSAVNDVLTSRPPAPPNPQQQQLKADVAIVAEKRYDEVIGLWRTAEYGNETLKVWATAYDRSGGKDRIRNLVIDICVTYVDLCILWPRHVHAIQALPRYEAYWAFIKPRPPIEAAAAVDPRIPIRRKTPKKGPSGGAARRRPRASAR